jgi:hypothetical protein
MSEGFGRDRQALRESLIVTGDFPQESRQGRRVGSA